MGAAVNFLPFTFICFFIGSFVIMGFPFLTAFYSKDIILELSFSRYLIDAGLYVF
jgi:NADH-ubiquinone oxidoreductase chain 5